MSTNQDDAARINFINDVISDSGTIQKSLNSIFNRYPPFKLNKTNEGYILVNYKSTDKNKGLITIEVMADFTIDFSSKPNFDIAVSIKQSGLFKGTKTDYIRVAKNHFYTKEDLKNAQASLLATISNELKRIYKNY